MTLCFSRPFEELQVKAASGPVRVHTLIVGSGYGAAFSALALAMRDDFVSDKTKTIMVLERGNEFVPGDFPKTMSDLPAHISAQSNGTARTGYADALFDFRIGEHVMAIVGSGLGGTSLINAGVAVDPDKLALSHFPPPDHGTWLENIAGSLSFVRGLLQVQAHPRGNLLKKVQALRRIAEGLGGKQHHHLADIAVSFRDGENSVGVKQSQCNDCGNCFTGCNTGAKNTLAMNAWPLAKDLGVEIVTGGTADCVVENVSAESSEQYRWQVKAYRTTDVTAGAMVTIEAKCVILAAGTFGSTEILKRSSQKGLPLPTNVLGSRFSLNGDDLGFGFGQSEAVEAYAKVPSAVAIKPQPGEKPGPTIVSLVSINDGISRGLLEDATVPQAIARPWAEVLSTQAMTRGYMQDSSSAWHQNNPGHDPLAVFPALMDHHQVVLGMANEATFGRLEFADNPGKYSRGQLDLHWPPAYDASTQAKRQTWLESRLIDAEKHRGFDGGFFLSNPFFRPIPESLGGVFEGASQLGGTRLCNHPLGGCPMGADAATGVVNAMGQVFSSNTGAAVHAGLYVLDGSIVPAALGINPYMTISAIAHHLASRIAVPGPVGRVPGVPRCRNSPIELPLKTGQRVDWPFPTLAFKFRERLFTSCADPNTEQLRIFLGQKSEKPPNHSLVIDAEIHIPDMYGWLADPAQSLDAGFTVYDCVQGFRIIDTVPEVDLGPPLISAAPGVVRLFAPDPARPSTVKLWWRAALALWRFYLMRRDEIFAPSGTGKPKGPSQDWFSKLKDFWRLAKQHGYWRCLDYSFEAQIKGRRVRAHGRKTLAYDGSKNRNIRDESNPWTTLTNINLTFSDTASGEQVSAWFRVDLVRMAKNINPLQLSAIAETPQVATAVGGLGFLTARVLVQTHLMSFGAPSYELFPSKVDIEKRYRLHDVPPFVTYVKGGKPVDFPVTLIDQPVGEGWRLLKVQATPTGSSSKPPVLLIHGMAHSSRVFYTDTVDRNLAGYLLDAGYDVWLLDHGLSIALRQPANYDPTIDDVSLQVTAAIKRVSKETNQKVLIFSHCVGSAALSRSILLGTLDHGAESLIDRLVMHAIPPWIYPSETNLLRAYIGVFFKDRFFANTIDPIPRSKIDNPSAASMVVDRLAFSIPWIKADYERHVFQDADHEFGRTICNRMTAFYGYEWSHDQLDDRTHKNLPSLVGPTGVHSFRQLYFLLNRKRVTNVLGVNDSLIQCNVERSWKFPTLFIHGKNNKVFDSESSALSAHQLVTLRRFFAWKTGEKQQPVELRVIGNYGHMDLLFGKNAARDVFPHIVNFFDNRPGGLPIPEPQSETQAPIRPMTGPIISQPTYSDNAHWIRIWAETNEFQTSRAVDIEFRRTNDKGQPIRIDSGSRTKWRLGYGMSSASNELHNSTFWLTNIACDGLEAFVPYVINEKPGIVIDAPANLPIDADHASIGLHAIEGNGAHDAIDWRDLAWFRRFLDNSEERSVSFIVGSCWYPASWFDHDLSDRVFGCVQNEITRPDGPDHLLLVGDQIYADASYAIFDIAEHRERYQESYRRAFNSPNARWVLSHIPTYFAIDDHEFRDNYPTPFPGDQKDKGNQPDELEELGRIGAQEAWNFQMSHGIQPPLQPARATPTFDNRLWYSFNTRQFRCFVFDTRSERNPLATDPQRRLIGEAQETGFIEWAHSLTRNPYPDGMPLFIVTGSPLVPIPTDEMVHPARASSSDSLRAYPEFLEMVATQLLNAQIRQTVIWLSGDPHYSAMGRFWIYRQGTTSPLKCVGIVASGVSVPLPFANDRADNVTWPSDHAIRTFVPVNSNIRVEVSEDQLLSTSRGHILRIDVGDASGSWTLRVGVIDADNLVSSAPPITWSI